MKKRFLPIFMGILSITILLSFTFFSCSTPGATSNPGTNNGSLAISINDSVSADTAPAVGGPEEDIFPTISMDPASYHIAGIGPNGATFEETTTGNSLVVDALAFGDWTLTITALNADPTSIGVGSAAATVQSNATSMVNVIVRPYDGLGTLDLSLAWTAEDVNTPQVVSTLQPNAGLTRTLDFTVAGASASFSADDVPTGYHTLVLKLLDNGILTMGAVDVVRIVADNTTSGSFLFDKINKATGTIEVGITPEMGDPLTVEIAGGADTKPENQSMALTASVTNYANNVNYVWYVNGDSVETGATFDFDDSRAQGYYRIDVTAYNTDGSRAGSDSVFVEVVEGELSSSIVQIENFGNNSTLIVKEDGSLWITGWIGGFFDEDNTRTNIPVKIIEKDVKAVSAGNEHVMILKTDGSLWASGQNSKGQLGNGTLTDSRVPIEIFNNGVQDVWAGYFYTMILKTDGSLWSFGTNQFGQLGIGSDINYSAVPVEVQIDDVQDISLGSNHITILKNDGSLWAIGNNTNGQFGNGTTTGSSVPLEIQSGDIQTVAAFSGNTMIIKTDGSLWGTGQSYYGELGFGTGDVSNIFVEIINNDVKSISMGWQYSMIIKTDGSLWATGRNQFGQFGNGTTINSLIPVEILDSGVNTVSCGFSTAWTTVILKTDGTLWSSGQNNSGQFGDGTTTGSDIFVQAIF